MKQVQTSSRLQNALELVETLSSEDQHMLIDIIRQRLREQKREQLSEEIAQARADYKSGNIKYGTAQDVIKDILS